MKFLRSNWFISMLLASILIIGSSELLLNHYRKKNTEKIGAEKSIVPRINTIAYPKEKEMISYGKELIANTAKYFGPHGKISTFTNGINCQDCHLEAGTKLYA